MGDPAGIGPEIIAKSFRVAPGELRGAFVVGDVACMRRACDWVKGERLALPVARIDSPAEAAAVPPYCVPVLQVGPDREPPPVGHVQAEAGAAAAQAVVWAARAALNGEVAAMVTAPLNKEALSAAGWSYPGHTELLQAEAARHLGRGIADVPVRMMLAN